MVHVDPCKHICQKHLIVCKTSYLLIAKLHAYGFDKTSTEYLKAYLSHRKQKIKINKAFSNWTNIKHGVPQGSILGLYF